MSQRLKAGLSWPPLAVPTGKPLGVVPRSFTSRPRHFCGESRSVLRPSTLSEAWGVAQWVKPAWAGSAGDPQPFGFPSDLSLSFRAIFVS